MATISPVITPTHYSHVVDNSIQSLRLRAQDLRETFGADVQVDVRWSDQSFEDSSPRPPYRDEVVGVQHHHLSFADAAILSVLRQAQEMHHSFGIDVYCSIQLHGRDSEYSSTSPRGRIHFRVSSN